MKYTVPGFIDMHVHLRDPGQTHKEDFRTGTRAAVAGGFTTVCDMPNNTVPVTTSERLREKKRSAKREGVCMVLFYFGSLGDNLQEFLAAAREAVGLKLYLGMTTGGFLLDEKKMRDVYEAWNGGPILIHTEDGMIDRVLSVAAATYKPTHICHINTGYLLKKIIDAKLRGIPVTCGVTPHHLFLTRDDEQRLGPFARMKPPLGTRKDAGFLWDHLGDIDAVESDHAPHTRKEKEATPAPYGVPGLETTIPLLLNAAHQDRLSMDDINRLCHTGPRDILGIRPAKGDTVTVDTEMPFAFAGRRMQTKCGWTPFEGVKGKGGVVSVQVRGTEVFRDGMVIQG